MVKDRSIWLIFQHCPPKQRQLVQCASGCMWPHIVMEQNHTRGQQARPPGLDYCTQTVQVNPKKYIAKSSDGKFHCDKCPFTTAAKSSLVRHMLRHSVSKPHCCNICGKGFIQKSDLTIHLLQHSGEKPFKCDLCSKAYTSRSALTKHRILHVDM
ncbi:Zinc finger protein 2 [Araneus ventricosus]|uniref:Zinc finger protein 2 n=1 Tax=Araneus ventricosus TaxID=182803 RepID=A0A4Y2HNR0_ARAVE|nr:Zinc finger protein 2 [Araneus ventricosus]